MTELETLKDQLHSAKFILEECDPEQLAKISGLPLGVIVAALNNIFQNDEKSN